MVIKNGIVVQEESVCPADIRVVDGKIQQIAPNIQPLPEEQVIDATGKHLLPGGVDVHTHFDMPAANCYTADDFASASYAAIAGGTTTVIDFAECEKPDCLQEGLSTWHKKADGKSYCDYGFHMTLACWHEGMEEQVKQMMEEGISSFKAYTAYKGVMGVEDTALYQMMECLQRMGAILCVHCENGEVLDYLQAKYKRIDPANVGFHPLSRPNLVEKEAVSRVLDFAAMTGVTVYIVHVSTKEATQVIELAKSKGQKVFAETCPHYLLLDDALYKLPDFESAKYVMSPPLRKQADQQALWSALNNHTIDTVSTDHCSFTFHEQKVLGKEDFTQIPNGIPGVEHRLELMLTHGLKQGMSLTDLCKNLSSNPARIFGMYPQKGVLAVGSDADIVIANLQQTHTITAKTSVQKTDYTPFEGMVSTVSIENVFLRGEQVVNSKKVVAEQPTGKFIKRYVNI